MSWKQSSDASAFGRWWKLQEVGCSRRKLIHWGCALEGDIGSLAFAPSLSLLPDYLEVSSFLHHALPAMAYCFTIGAKATGPSYHGLIPLKP
jgi:hypothetical protein